MEDPEDIFAAALLLDLFVDEDIEIYNALAKPKRHHSIWVRPWIKDREDETQQNTQYKLQKQLVELDDTKEFRKMLRMTPDLYHAILERLQPRLQLKDTHYRQCIPPAERLSLTLKYLAFGNEAADLAQQYRVGLCTVGRIIKDTCGKIYQEFHEEYLHTPTTTEEWNGVVQDFQDRWDYPGCIGALDGKHIRIRIPNKSGTLYYNYKKYFSIVLMVIVNANYEIIFVDVGAQGKVADGGCWKATTFYEALNDGDLNIPKSFTLHGTDQQIPIHLVADDAFAMCPNLLKPYSHRNLPPKEQIFNYRLSRARGVVENVFGILASRFRVFKSEIQMNPDDTSMVVLAACTLHNILRRCIGRAYLNTGSLPVQEEDDIPWDGLDVNHNRNATQMAKDVRDQLANYFISAAGQVHWQYNKVIY